MCAYVHMEISRKMHIKLLIVMASRDSHLISFNRKLVSEHVCILLFQFLEINLMLD